MPYYCTVPRCTSMAGKAKNVSFHQFPRDLELARLWNDILKRGKPYTKYSKVCSLHFRPEDYTITSVGKNKGQWRTLRKDAVPSQNLPSETPAPYSRKQWDSWSPNCGTSNVIDLTIQQQMAQAIYMQTMLAMQAAGHSDAAPIHNGPTLPELPSPHTSNHDKLKTPDTNSYKCNECTKCFKDPDVFILHKRSHSKTIEKENFNMNLTLQSNPILANLLKSNSESFEPIMAMENLLMTALAANIDYIRNYSMTKDNDEAMNHDRSENFTRHHVNNNGNHENHSNEHSSNERCDGSPNSLNSDEVNDRNEIQVRNDLVISRMENPTASSRQNSRNDEDNYENIDDSSVDMNSFRTVMNSPRTDMNSPRSDINSSRTDMNNCRSDITQCNQIQGEVETLSQERINTHSVNVNLTGHVGLSVRRINYEKDFSEDITTKRLSFSGNNYTEDENDFRVRSSDDLNESMDSNNLVIDESVGF